MHIGVAIDLGRRGLKYLCLGPFGEAQHVDRAHNRGLGRLNRVKLVVNRARRTSQIVDFVDLHKQRKGHVMAD